MLRLYYCVFDMEIARGESKGEEGVKVCPGEFLTYTKRVL